MVYRRRATISDIETGKSEVTVSTLALIAAALEKPITYFLPWFVYDNLEPEDLAPLEQELLIQFRKIWSKDLKQLAIMQTSEIAQMSIKQFQKDKTEIPEAQSREDQNED
jgi:transcriptional regulator with XRE-family HTH domain